MKTQQMTSPAVFEMSCSLAELSKDLKRMLVVQFKEFVHHIEDYEHQAKLSKRLAIQQKVVAAKLNTIDGFDYLYACSH